MTEGLDNVNNLMPNELRDILQDIVITSRGFLAHIGIRENGKSFSESIDRATVFYTNSKKIVESIEPMKIIKYAIENGINNFSEAVTTTDMINDYDIAETQLIGDE